MSDHQQLDTMREIGQLLYKRLKEELSPSEEQTLENWLNQQDLLTRQSLENMTEPEEILSALSVMYSFDEESAFLDVQKKIEALTGVAFPSVSDSTSYSPSITTAFPQYPEAPVRSLWQRYRVAAAASVILVIGGAAYFLNHKPQPSIPAAPAPIAQRFHNDVAPGGDKAILQLADGSTIVLDSASNGQLATQGKTRVIKLDDGQLAYKAPSADANAITYNMISTPRGGQYQIVLPDGSKVWLNAASSLRFPTAFAGEERKVELNGEAYFEVAKNAALPFKVAVTAAPGKSQDKSMEIEVLGTAFDVMAYADEAGQKTTLISGSVKVNAGTEQKQLTAGQQILLSNTKGSPTLNLITDADTEETLAWKNGLFQFQDASIESIMRQVSRWYDVEVVYNGKVNQQFIGKIPRQVNISTLLKILESTGWVHFTIEGKKITVAP